MSILSTELEVYSGASGPFDGEKIGVSIIKTGSPATVTIDYESLSAYLEPGEQYSVRARCTNTDSYVTDWTSPYPFKTLIEASISSVVTSAANVISTLEFNYNSEVISVSSCGVYISTNASGANAVKKSTNQQDAEQGYSVEMAENTTYYVIPFVIDSLNREYKPEWTDAEEVTTSYKSPTVTVSSTVTTSDSISGSFNVATNDTLDEVELTLTPAGGGTIYHFAKTATAGTQMFTIASGDTDDDGKTVSISPSTEYIVRVSATNTSGGTGSGSVNVTTPQQETSTIAITSISDVTPYSAVVNLSYGDGA